MSLPGERKRNLHLEKDLLLTKNDFGAIRALQPGKPEDLGSYLDFLGELWGTGRKETKRSFYSNPFKL